MQNPLDEVDDAIQANKRLTLQLKKYSTTLVRSRDEIALLKATALAWFQNQRPHVLAVLDETALESIDAKYKDCLQFAERSTSRKKYLGILLEAKQSLVQLRSTLLTHDLSTHQNAIEFENPPDYGPLIPDPKMHEILVRRWQETQKCLIAEAPLSATVMMGGLLEATLLARLNAMLDKGAAFKATSSPKDTKTNKTLPLKEWSLRNFIDVAHELGWIGQSAKDVGTVLRDYRNYVHPAKELSHGMTITTRDSHVLWAIFVSLTKQLLASVPRTSKP